MLENNKEGNKPSIDIFLKAHSMVKQDKLDRFVDFFKSIPSFEDCYLKGQTTIDATKLKENAFTTKNITVKDNVTFEIKSNYFGTIDDMFKNTFGLFTKKDLGGKTFEYIVPGDGIVKMTNDDISNFIFKINGYKTGKMSIKTKSSNPQINANVAKLSLKEHYHVYIPDNNLEMLNILFRSPYPNPIQAARKILSDNPLTKNAIITGTINNKYFKNLYIYSVEPNEKDDAQNKKNLKQLYLYLKQTGVFFDVVVLSKKKNVYAKKIIEIFK